MTPDQSTSLPLTGAAELLPSLRPRPQLSHVVFDFDGTLSWIRHGWPRMMMNLFARYWPASAVESAEERNELFHAISVGMAGKPTVVQMMRFAESVRQRGGPALEPEALRREYQGELDQEIAARAARIRSGAVTREAYVVHGARGLIEKVCSAGLRPYILSTTTETRVREEADLLDLARFFDGRINGSGIDATAFSKRAVFDRILGEEGISGDRLLSFGDGPIELADTKQLGGIAIAICSDEDENGSGRMDPHKKSQLLTAGADAVLPDFRDAGVILDYLLAR